MGAERQLLEHAPPRTAHAAIGAEPAHGGERLDVEVMRLRRVEARQIPLLPFDRKRAVRPGNLFVMYVGGYALGRLWIEALRADTASLIFGIRVNIWASILTLLGVVVVFAVRGVRRRPDDTDEPYRDGYGPAPTDAPESPDPATTSSD